MKTEYRNLLRDEKRRFRKKAISLTDEQRCLAEAHILDAVIAVKSSSEVSAGLIEFEDAIAEGYLTLSRCAKDYEDRGFEFRTYVSCSIRWRMKEIARERYKNPCILTDEIPDEGAFDSEYQRIELGELIEEIEEKFPPPVEGGILYRLIDGKSLVDIQREHPEIHYDQLRRYKKKIRKYLEERHALIEAY